MIKKILYNFWAICLIFGVVSIVVVGFNVLKIEAVTSDLNTSDLPSLTVTDLIFTNATGTALSIDNLKVNISFNSSGTNVLEPNVGIGTTTPSAYLAIEARAGDDSFMIGSSTKTYLRVNQAGQILMNKNVQSSPAYSFIGDTDTGIFSDSVNTLSLIANNTLGLHIQSNGDVMVGTTTAWAAFTIDASSSPDMAIILTSGTSGYAEYKTVDGIGTNKWSWGSVSDVNTDLHPNAFFVYQYSDQNDSGVDEYRFVIDDNGLIGIGTTSPKSILSVSNASQSSTNLLTVASTTNQIYFEVQSTGNIIMAQDKEFRALNSDGTSFGMFAPTSSASAVNMLTTWRSAGPLSTSDNAGVHFMYNYQATGALAQGVILSPSIGIDNEVIATFYAESDGSGGIQNKRMGIGTTTPYSVLSVSTVDQQAGSTALFTVASTTGAVLFQVLADGTINQPSQIFMGLQATTTQNLGTSMETVAFQTINILNGNISYANPTTTINVTGKYNIEVNLWCDKTGGATQLCEAELFKGSTGLSGNCSSERMVNSNNETGDWGFNCTRSFVVGDEIVLRAGGGAENRLIRTGSLVTGDPAVASFEIKRVD